MNIAELRPQFAIYAFVGDPQMGGGLREILSSSGYALSLFNSEAELFAKLAELPPHVLLFHAPAVTSSMSDFFDRCLQVTSEIQMIAIATSNDIGGFEDYRQYNLAGLLEAGEELGRRALWLIDEICSRLAYQYQNERMLDRINQIESDNKVLRQDREESSIKAKLVPVVEPGLFADLSAMQSKEELIRWFFSHLEARHNETEKVHGLFFKYLPTVSSFVATAAAGVVIDKIKGVGAKISKEESDHLNKTLLNGELPAGLTNILKKAFQVESCSVLTLFAQGKIEGAFVCWPLAFSELEKLEFGIFQICYENLHFKKKVNALEVQDPNTELYNKSFYYLRLEEEVSRARRLAKPVSVVRLALDNGEQIEAKIGPEQRNLILRTVALLVKKTSRVNDFACRTGENEIALILPHSNKKGAALRAERLRKTVEGHSFSVIGSNVTLSVGVSEYPSLCSTMDELDKSCIQALNYIQSSGGNKVCIFKPADGFKPDFEVNG